MLEKAGHTSDEGHNRMVTVLILGLIKKFLRRGTLVLDRFAVSILTAKACFSAYKHCRVIRFNSDSGSIWVSMPGWEMCM